MPELRRDLISHRWIITGTQSEEEFFSSLNPKPKEAGVECFFCEGNETKTLPEIYSIRKFDTRPNTPGWQVRVVPSKSAAFKIEGDVGKVGRGIYDMMNNIGAHELIIESPKHIKNICELPPEQILLVLKVYQTRLRDLNNDERLKYALIFKNQRPQSPFRYGHTHSQLAAIPLTPKAIKDELISAKNYFSYKERCLFCDIIRQEQKDGKRIVEENTDYISFVPFAAKFPFELLIMPKIHNADFKQESETSMKNLAQILKISLSKIARTLNDPPLTYILHTIPYLRPKQDYWKTIYNDFHWHIEIYPKTVENATGFELGSGCHIEPLLPETCAKLLSEK
ncbi:MAG TPA: galactose-1-phosphate uridylyltransferase [Elusimicrobia bacterium]|nr:galactose-1-phosphate uridylyltransferase [Elusimicrobiota bacterium]